MGKGASEPLEVAVSSGTPTQAGYPRGQSSGHSVNTCYFPHPFDPLGARPTAHGLILCRLHWHP